MNTRKRTSKCGSSPVPWWPESSWWPLSPSSLFSICAGTILSARSQNCAQLTGSIHSDRGNDECNKKQPSDCDTLEYRNGEGTFHLFWRLMAIAPLLCAHHFSVSSQSLSLLSLSMNNSVYKRPPPFSEHRILITNSLSKCFTYQNPSH